jgi:hypothetical protein
MPFSFSDIFLFVSSRLIEVENVLAHFREQKSLFPDLVQAL